MTAVATSTLIVTRRALLRFLRTPQLIVVGTLQMAGFMLVYRYVFGGAIDSGDVPYVDYLIPGFVTTGVLFTGIGAAVAMAEDLEQGFVDRLRSLPIPRSSVLAGRATADTAILVWLLGVTVALGFAVGFRLHGSALEGLAAFGLVVLFGYVFEWVFIAVGLFAGNAQAAQGMGLLVFPLTFLSSAYVPVDSMPGVLQAFAEHQPITYMVDAVRQLTLGQSPDALPGALLWSAAILAVCAPLAVARYRRG
jgi:ABC-2 type transport system permease protein